MKLKEYHDKAMSTNAESSDNIVYSLLGLNAEVGVEATYLRNELLKEVGDVLWFCAHLSRQLGSTLDEVAKMNIEKLRDRAMRNVIIGEGR